MNATEISNKLNHFHGSEQTYFTEFLSGRIYYSEGINYLLEEAECVWLLSLIFSYQTKQFRNFDYLQFWKLIVTDNSAVLTCDDGNSNIRVTKSLEYTDFPLPSITIYVSTDNDRVFLYLPSEH